MMSRQKADAFIEKHRLPAAFARLLDEHFLPLADWLLRQYNGDRTLIVGINGAQGTGKSTLADLLRVVLEGSKRHVAVLSIDDFYLMAGERRRLADRVHPLLRTRGVPGTHDLALLTNILDRLSTLCNGETLRLPAFDKARDDRVDHDRWPALSGPIDLVVLEGWCVGSRPQSEEELERPINELEREDDPDGRWRRFVNSQLEGPYARLFARLDRLVFLQAPNFDAVYNWRMKQERKLASRAGGAASRIMSPQQIARFIQHYERLTRANIQSLAGSADVVMELDDAHQCVRSRYR